MEQEIDTSFAFDYSTSTVSPFYNISDDDPNSENNTSDIFATNILGYCGTSIKPFQKWYSTIHGYNSLLLCLIGMLANILNLIVFTRNSMKNPTNVILTGLAFADLLKITEYIPYAVYLLLPKSRSYAWAVYVLFHSNFSQVCHTISILLTVTLVIWRYIMVAKHGRGRTLCSLERAYSVVKFAYGSSPFLCIPIYLSFSVKVLRNNLNRPINSSEYVVNLSEMAAQNPGLMKANFWFYRWVKVAFTFYIKNNFFINLRFFWGFQCCPQNYPVYFAHRCESTVDLLNNRCKKEKATTFRQARDSHLHSFRNRPLGKHSTCGEL